MQRVTKHFGTSHNEVTELWVVSSCFWPSSQMAGERKCDKRGVGVHDDGRSLTDATLFTDLHDEGLFSCFSSWLWDCMWGISGARVEGGEMSRGKTCLLQVQEVVESLLCLLNGCWDAVTRSEIVSKMNPGTSHCWPSPQQTHQCVNNHHLLCLFNIEAKIMGSAPHWKLLKLHSVCWLIIFADQSQQCCVVSKLGSAVMYEQAEQRGASKVSKKKVLFLSSKTLTVVYFLFNINTYSLNIFVLRLWDFVGQCCCFVVQGCRFKSRL